MRSKLSRGYSLIELLIGATIIALALYLSLRLVAPATRDADIQAHTAAVSGWISRARDCAAAQLDFSACDVGSLRALAPTGWLNGSTVRAPIGGNLTIAPTTYGGVTNGAALFSHAVPRAVCRDIAVALQPLFSVMTINSVTIKSGPTVTFTPATAEARCTAASNTLTGVFVP